MCIMHESIVRYNIHESIIRYNILKYYNTYLINKKMFNLI